MSPVAYEDRVEVRRDEVVVLYGQSSVETGTLSVLPGATFTLYDSAGQSVPALTGVPITGYDVPGAVVRVWYRLDTVGLPPGVYNGVFTYTVVASEDSINRVDRPDIQLHILQEVEVPATYDLTTAIGQCRLVSGDKDLTEPVLNDAEWQYLLDQAGTTPEGEPRIFLAVSLFFHQLANTHAPLSTLEKVAIFETDEKKAQDALVERIKAMERLDLQRGYGTPRVLATTERFSRFPPADGITRPLEDW